MMLFQNSIIALQDAFLQNKITSQIVMRSSSRLPQSRIPYPSKIRSNQQLGFQHQADFQQQLKPQTSQQMFMNNRNNLVFGSNSNINQHMTSSRLNNPTETHKTNRKQLHIVVFLLVICVQIAYTIYPAITFSRLNYEYEFFIMGFAMAIFYLIVTGHLMREFQHFVGLYCLLDSMMVLIICLVGTYTIPYVLFNMKSVPKVLQCVGFGVCNFTMVGNFRVMLMQMQWGQCKVIIYKLCRLIQVLFYIAFGAYYKLSSVSFSMGTDSSLDSKIEYIVLLFVLSGFALQLQMLNTVSEFDKCNRLRTDYQILEEGEEVRSVSKDGAVANSYYYNTDNKQQGEMQLSKQQQLYLINLLQQQLQQTQQQLQSPINDSQPISRSQVKHPHYPSINQLPSISNHHITVSHNLNEIHKLQKKIHRNSIQY